ncbi:MAG: hypothetical protein HFH92_17510 [Lachnospiraceae bacterium]|nr:hypothetical protein [Lachnospiraceae bacterium]
MAEYVWDEFWWNSITGPHIVVLKVSEALLDNHMVVLVVPADLPWRHSMRGAIHTAFRETLNVGDVIIELIDAVDDNPDNIEPGKFILSRFASGTIRRGYREKSKVSIQDYITAKKVIRNRIIWVKGLGESVTEQWIQFCRGFSPKSVLDGLFVLEVQEKIRQSDIRPLEVINFRDYVSSYDVQLFNSFLLDGQDNYSDMWKKYISTVVAVVCDTDAEISAHILSSVDLKVRSVIDGLQDIVALPEYSRRGAEANSNHVLWYSRHNDCIELERRIWSAQVQVLFPIIELERVRLIRKWHNIIQEALDNNDISQFNELIRDPMDVELGTLCYMMKHRTDRGLYILYIPDEKERERISFLHDCRNQLAHATCCTTDQIVQLLSPI